LSSFPSLQSLKYSRYSRNNDDEEDDAETKYCFNLPELKYVSFHDCTGESSNAVVAILSGATNLEHVCIDELNVIRPLMRNQMMEILSDRAKTSLQTLEIWNYANEFFDKLRPDLLYPIMKSLTLADLPVLTDSMTSIISKAMPNLEYIELCNIPEISDAANRLLINSQCIFHLKTLYISDVCIKEDSLLQMILKCERLERLNLVMKCLSNCFLSRLRNVPVVKKLTVFFFNGNEMTTISTED
jgi:Leucine-rich repeat (LRR) protein